MVHTQRKKKRKPQLSPENIEALKRDIEKRGIVAPGLIEQAGLTPPPGTVQVPKFFSPSAQQRTEGGGFIAPPPEQVRGGPALTEEQKADIAARGELAETVGLVHTPVQSPRELDFEQARKSALALAAPTAVGGAVIGGAAVALAPVTGGLTLLIPAGTALAAFVSSYYLKRQSNLKAQRKDMLKGATLSLLKTEQNLRMSVIDIETG